MYIYKFSDTVACGLQQITFQFLNRICLWGWGGGIVCTLPFLQVRGGVEPPKKFFKNGGTWQDLSFYIKNKQKSEIFNDKKSL